MGQDLGKTSINVDPKLAALLSYVAGFVTGIVFLLIEKDNKYVRFHAMQSTIVSGGVFVLQWVLALIPFLVILAPLVGLAGVVLWIVCMVKAFQGEKFKLPIIGDIAEKQVG